MSKDTRAGRVFALFGLLAGAAVGVAVALVYSPNDGRGNRKQLNQWAHNRLEEAQHKLEKAS
jgi:gas vesicle protein